MPTPLIVKPESSPRPLNVVGETVTVLASGAQTGGYEVFLQTGPENSGPPPHNHPWDESFYVIRGEIAFGVGDAETLATPGTFVHLPGGTTHWFRFGKGGGEMVSISSREGASRMFTDLDREIAPDNPDPVKLVEIAGRHGVAVISPKN